METSTSYIHAGMPTVHLGLHKPTHTPLLALKYTHARTHTYTITHARTHRHTDDIYPHTWTNLNRQAHVLVLLRWRGHSLKSSDNLITFFWLTSQTTSAFRRLPFCLSVLFIPFFFHLSRYPFSCSSYLCVMTTPSFFHLSVRPSIRPSIRPCVRVSVYPSVRPPVCSSARSFLARQLD